jgi:hypothetical protein
MTPTETAAMPCPRCNAHIEAGTTICPKCGHEPTAGERAEFEQRKRHFRRKSWALVCKVYMGIGLCSILAGAVLIFGPSLVMGKVAAKPDPALGLVAAILIGFGIVRIVNAAYQLRRMRPGRPALTGARGFRVSDYKHR